MKPHVLTRRITAPDSKDIDEMYGLEPVYEPGQGGATGTADEFVALLCPWCSERLDLRVDTSAGAQTFVEDCQVCCRPMELTLEFADSGLFQAIKVQRQD